MKVVISKIHPLLHIHSMQVIQQHQQSPISTTTNTSTSNNNDNDDDYGILKRDQISSSLWQKWIQQPSKEEDHNGKHEEEEWNVELRVNEEYLKAPNPIVLQIQYML